MQKGFTLIELLIVVLIIGILAAVALPQYTKSVDKARAAEALMNLASLHGSMERYYLENGSYPVSLQDLDIEITDSKNWKYLISANLSIYADSLWTPSDVNIRIAYRNEHGYGAANKDQYADFICTSTNNAKKAESFCKSIGATTSIVTLGDRVDWILKK